eukprot:TRINITY_DN2627_c0_g3_i1.p1 TRINITY_DN2627_c0_g3~~TRINITY_DN2627_c0_g3_i1.p1  ORF type:complete len:601 (-),score=182.74 TRINITY_DN2627_c0_g3_i1:84-1862(-)
MSSGSQAGTPGVVEAAAAKVRQLFKVEEAGHIDAVVAYLKEVLESNDLDIKIKLRPKAACHFNCGAYGPGLEGGEVDIEAEFTIQAKDNTGRNLTHGDSPFAVTIAAKADPSKTVPCTIADNHDGTFKVTYTPENAGPHSVAIKLDGKDINGSPYAPTIDPPTPDPSKCDVEGAGLTAAVVGEPAAVTVRARNRVGAPLKVGGHPFTLEAVGPHKDAAPSKLKDNGDGTYSGDYTPLHAGKQEVKVKLGDKHVAKSPYTADAGKNAAWADACKCEAFGPGVEGGCTTAEPALFTVQAIGPNGEKLATGGHPFDVEVMDAEENPVPVTLKDNNDGTYSGSYQPLKPEKHTVEVVLRHPKEPLYYEHIKNSPFHPQILPGIDASKCTAQGPGVQHDNPNVVDTFPAPFTIQANDILGKKLHQGGDPFEVAVKGPDGKPIPTPASIKDNGDGTYAVEYNPIEPGEHTVEVTLKGKPVGESPFTVSVKAGCHPESSRVGQMCFVIRAKGKDGAPLKAGGEASALHVAVLQNGKEVEGEAPKVQDVGDGTYVVSYTLPLLAAAEAPAAEGGKAEYEIACTVNGQHILGSPFQQVLPL